MIDELVKAQKLRMCDLCKVAKEPRAGLRCARSGTAPGAG